MILDLIRHADTGRRGWFDGRCDSPLLPDAARSIATAHAGITWNRIVSSPRQRTHDTARALALNSANSIELSEDWAEWDFGDWDGRHRDDIPVGALDAFHRDPFNQPPPNAEPWSEFEARVRRGLHALLAQAGDDEPTLVVTHAGALRMAIAISCGIPMTALWSLRIDYGTRARLRIGLADDNNVWGELIELRQSCDV